MSNIGGKCCEVMPKGSQRLRRLLAGNRDAADAKPWPTFFVDNQGGDRRQSPKQITVVERPASISRFQDLLFERAE